MTGPFVAIENALFLALFQKGSALSRRLAARTLRARAGGTRTVTISAALALEIADLLEASCCPSCGAFLAGPGALCGSCEAISLGGR